jgi:hypothetical protein
MGRRQILEEKGDVFLARVRLGSVLAASRAAALPAGIFENAQDVPSFFPVESDCALAELSCPSPRLAAEQLELIHGPNAITRPHLEFDSSCIEEYTHGSRRELLERHKK